MPFRQEGNIRKVGSRLSKRHQPLMHITCFKLWTTSTSSVCAYSPILKIKLWCRRPDSNRHRLRDQLLGLACLPVPPRRQTLKRWCRCRNRTDGLLLTRRLLCQAREIMVGSQGVEPRVSRRTAGLRPVAVASAARCPSNWCGRWDSNPWPRRWRRRVLPD
jgi:hypothetical protein